MAAWRGGDSAEPSTHENGGNTSLMGKGAPCNLSDLCLVGIRNPLPGQLFPVLVTFALCPLPAPSEGAYAPHPSPALASSALSSVPMLAWSRALLSPVPAL